MKDNDLELLRQLPKVRASAGFAETVVERAREMERAGGNGAGVQWRRPRWALAASVAVVLTAVAIFWGAQWHVRNERRRAALAELERIRDEQRQVARQISNLRQAPEPTIVYLGGDQNHDFVLDVGRLVEWAREAKKSAGPSQNQSPTNL